MKQNDALFRMWTHIALFFDRHQYRDPLTGLKNQSALNKTIDLFYKEPAVVQFVLKNYEELNDEFGYEYTNELILKVAAELKQFESMFDIYRISGKRFLLVTENFSNFVDYVNTDIKSFIDLLNSDASLNFVAGIGIGAKAEEDSRNAVKNSTGETVAWIDRCSIEEKDYVAAREMTKKIRQALKEDTIIPYFQPIFNVKTKRIEKVECLVRMIDPIDNKIVPPVKFLDVARMSNLYSQIQFAMLKKSVEAMKNSNFDFSINMSNSDLINKTMQEYLIHIVSDFPDVAKRLVIEVLEYESIDNEKEVIDFLNHLKMYGVKVAIDDFGSGYSNFERILRIHSDIIKIDGSLITTIISDKKSKSIIEMMCKFSKSNGIATVAEFVGNEELFKAVVDAGIDYVQGWYIAPAVKSIDDVEELNNEMRKVA